MTVLTYTGKLHNGKVELATQVNLPEGSEVYVVVSPGIEQRVAQRKANGWLVDQVGNMVMADDGVLVQRENTWIWRFHAYLTALAHEPYGPISYVDVDANSGAILSDYNTVEAMYERGARYLRPA
jgi:hypothetical protein